MKFFKTLGYMALAAITLPAFTSCKDDEPGNGDDADKEVVVIDGEHITSIGDLRIEYDKQGRVTEVDSRYGYEGIEIDYSKGTIDLYEAEGTIKFTKDGFISEINVAYDDDDDDYGYVYKGTGSIKFTYDSKRCTSITSTYSETATEVSTNETEKWNGTESYNYTWTNGNLVKVVATWKDYENGELEDEDTYTMTVAYGNQENKFKQFPLSLAYEIMDFEGVDVLAALGLAGEGPAYLPTSISEDNYDYSTSFSFTLNSNGSIASESYEGDTYAYTYNKLNTKSTFEKVASNGKKSVRTLFVKPSRRK